jgi:DNA-binding NtrC family response regulator
MLAYFFARTFNEEQRAGGGPARAVKVIHPDVIKAMVAYDWPGNVRDVYRNVKRMMIHGEGEILGPEGLDPDILEAGRRAGVVSGGVPAPSASSPAIAAASPGESVFDDAWLEKGFTEARKELDRAFGQWYLKKALAMSGGNKTRAAELARLQRPNLVRALKDYDVTLPTGDDS